MSSSKKRQGNEGDGSSTDRRTFLVDMGYGEGEEFCKQLLRTTDFSHRMLKQFAERGSKSLGREDLAAHVASRLENGEIDPDDVVLAYCKQPRRWLCVRHGTKGSGWSKGLSGESLLTKREKKVALSWYGPFGDGSTRWYVVTQNVKHYVEVSTDSFSAFVLRWQVVAEVGPDYVALHWNNASMREKESISSTMMFPYWHHLPEIFRTLAVMLDGEWDAEEPNLAQLVLHDAFDNYIDDPAFEWTHKGIRSSYESIALNASGRLAGNEGLDKEERAAAGLVILTKALAKTAAKAMGKATDKEAIRLADRAILKQILREWGTKSYEFVLNQLAAEDAAARSIARMRIYFGSDTPKNGKQTQDTIQHVHCFADYGGSTRMLRFILGGCEVIDDDLVDEELDEVAE